MIAGGIKKGLGGYLMPVGNIKIGGKGDKRKGKGGKPDWYLPVKFDHFKVTTTERGKDNNFLPDEAVMTSIGENEPKAIRVRFPFDDPALIFQTSYQKYNGRKLECEGNGIIAERRDKDGKIIEGKCDGGECKYMIDKSCKPSGRLACHLPDSPHYGGIYMYRTHGWNSTGGIMKALSEYHAHTGGILQGLPFRLVFTKKATEEHGNVPVVVLVLDGVELGEMRKLARTERQDRIDFDVDMKQIEHEAVVSGVLEDHDAPGDVADEYYSDVVDEPEAGTSSDDVMAAMDEADGAVADEPEPETDKQESVESAKDEPKADAPKSDEPKTDEKTDKETDKETDKKTDKEADKKTDKDDLF